MDTMDRKEFLSLVGLGAAALVFSSCLNGCTNPDTIVNAPTNVDFTLDISAGALSNDGGYLYHGGIIVARVSVDNFIAVSQACTHQGKDVQYVAGGNVFYCPSHGSTFSDSGSVTRGPARSALAKYKTSLNGASLHVFS